MFRPPFDIEFNNSLQIKTDIVTYFIITLNFKSMY
jgi:hypothetical protein